MKAFFFKHKKLHIWLLLDLAALAAYWTFRGNRVWMNALADNVTTPLKQGLGRLCYLVDFSVMEVIYVLAVLVAVVYVVWNVTAVTRSKGRRADRAYSGVLGGICAVLAVYAVFCLLWGINFWTDSFQEKSGIYAQPVTQEDLLMVTVYFANQVALTADAVERDESGVFAVPREEILANSAHIYDPLEKQMPFLEFDDPGVKPMLFSRLMSRMDFTGFYCSFTGESNVNVDSPASVLPATIAHELAHQRAIASEQECNFLAVLASTTSGDPVYEYSGWLEGYIYLSNALYKLSPEVYWIIRDALPETVEADLTYNNVYWKQFEDKVVQKVSTTVYDGALKAYGDERGIQSYGTVVDMLVAYYKNAV